MDFSGVTSFLGGGSFSLSLNNAATTLTLNFVPVPEPATYALLALGALVVFFTVRRRRA